MKMMMSSTISLLVDMKRIDKGFLKMMIRMVKPTMLSLDTQWREYCRHHILENSASLLMKMKGEQRGTGAGTGFASRRIT